jgi:hypothetical protein
MRRLSSALYCRIRPNADERALSHLIVSEGAAVVP